MENSYYNHANRAYFLCKSYLFVKFFVIFLFIANVTLANGNGTSELYDIKKGTLLEYFKDIEKETGYVFIYSKDIRPSLNQVVSVYPGSRQSQKNCQPCLKRQIWYMK